MPQTKPEKEKLTEQAKELNVLYISQLEEGVQIELLTELFGSLYVASSRDNAMAYYKKHISDLVLIDSNVDLNSIKKILRDIYNIYSTQEIALFLDTENIDIHAYIEAGICTFVKKVSDSDELLDVFKKIITNITTKKSVDIQVAALDAYDNIVFTTVQDNDGNIIDISNGYEKFTGYSIKEIHNSTTQRVLHDIVSGQSCPLKDDAFIFKGEYKQLHKDGNTYWVQSIVMPLKDCHGKQSGSINLVTDVTEKKKFEELARKDVLTNLYNRRHFNDVLTREVRRAKREKYSLAFSILDIDHFKKYNDTYGHLAGDEALQNVASELNASIHRGSDFAFRLGGEEFGLLFVKQNEEQAFKFIDEIRQKIQNLNIEHVQNSDLKVVTASFGLIVVDFSTMDIDENGLYSMADYALYRAKEEGRNRVVLHNDINQEDDLEFF